MPERLKFQPERPGRTANPMDLIESVLERLQLESTVFCRMELTGAWGFAKPALQGAPFHVILSGEAWLRLPAQRQPTLLRPGDVVILPGGDAHEIMSAPDSPLISFKALLAEHGVPPWSPGVRIKPTRRKYGESEGAVTHLVSGVFGFGDRRENPLLAALPRLFHLRAEEAAATAGGSWLTSTVAFLGAEVGSGLPGAGAVTARLADVLFIQAVRAYLASTEPKDPGWLRGIVDPQLGRVLARMHAGAEKPWTLAMLAQAAGMSRSRFAARFRAVVGQTPLDYLTRWRMYVAAGRLAEGKHGLAELAQGAGYRSEVAFSKAFKRWAGCSPAEFKGRRA